MSIRQKNGRWICEIYDPVIKKKVHVKPGDYDMDPPRNERQAKALERAALNARDNRRPGTGDEATDSFTERWADDYNGRGRGESTRVHNKERVRAFGQKYAGRTLRSIQRSEARKWGNDHPSTVPALRTMFADALDDGLCDQNPFARLGLEQSKGREHITVLSPDEITELADIARVHHGREFGVEMAAFITWSAYTCLRPGESFAARYGLLDGDVYDLRKQFNSKLGKETAPKHDSVGAIYVPEPAQRAVLDKPRRLADDLMFHGKRGQQVRQEAMWRWWDPVRAAFLKSLPSSHHLYQRLAIDPDDNLDLYELRHAGASYMLNVLELEPWVIAKQLRHSDDGSLVVTLYGHPTRESAIDRIRRAYTGAKVTQLRGTTAPAEATAEGTFGGHAQ